MDTVNVLLCGVGGQGVLAAGSLLATAALEAGYDVKLSASRADERAGESMHCHVRWGRKVHAPRIRMGGADFIIALDRLEALRHLATGRAEAVVIANDATLPCIGATLADELDERAAAAGARLHLVPARELAGDDALVAVTMLGAFASFNQCTEESWQAAMADASGEERAAFERGRAHARTPLRVEVAQRDDTVEAPATKGIRSFEEMLATVRTLPRRRVAIAGGQNAAALHAGIEAQELGLGTPVFVGPADSIRALAREKFPSFDIDAAEIIDVRDEVEIAARSVAIVRAGEADILLKGAVNTPTLMRAALSSKTGLRAGSLLSDTFVFEYPDEDGPRLIMITDGGVTLQPTIQQKVEILKNAVVVSHALGNPIPRVAILAASETINPNVAATMDAAVIQKMNRTGQIEGCIVEGPMALDVAVSRKAAAIKGTASDVAGQADILVTASIDTANALAKSTTYFAGYRLSHVIVGGTAPILIASRSDTADAKLLSVALGSLMAKYFSERG